MSRCLVSGQCVESCQENITRLVLPGVEGAEQHAQDAQSGENDTGRVRWADHLVPALTNSTPLTLTGSMSDTPHHTNVIDSN